MIENKLVSVPERSVQLFARDLLDVLVKHSGFLMQGQTFGAHLGVGESLYDLLLTMVQESGSEKDLQAVVNVIPLDASWNAVDPLIKMGSHR